VPIEVNLAKLSPTMESGQLVKWRVKVGDQVKEGDILAEIQTDKAVMDMEAFDNGTVALLDADEGDELALGQRVLVLAKKGEDPKQVAEQAAKGGTKGTQASIAVHKDFDSQEQTNTPNTPAPSAPLASPAQPGQTTAPMPEPAGSNGQRQAVAQAPATLGGRVKSSPLARKVAGESGIDLAQVPGSGPGGRVIRADVEAFLQNRATSPAPAAAARPAGAPIPGAGRIPHTPMRKTIAKRMLESQQTAPVIHVTVDVRIDSLMATREALNARLASEKVKLSVGDFITKAVAVALRRHPVLNASWEADALVVHPDVNIGIAVAMDGGLMVPVLHNADRLGLKEIRQGTEVLANATRGGGLKPNQMMGGTFTISNLGMYGVKQFDAIINLPEVAILAVGAGEKRPVVEGNSLVVGTVMTLNLTADHRAIDGATAAEFMRTLKGFLEEPATMLL
jgi:pyruvate dehydrogenase E2 component (dihydrolipoamide acetyltransferase)